MRYEGLRKRSRYQRQGQVITKILWDIIICPCPWCLLLANNPHNSSSASKYWTVMNFLLHNTIGGYKGYVNVSITWRHQDLTWWRHQMETFSALLAICAGNWPVPGEFPTQRPVTRSFDAYFDLRPNKRLSKQSWGWWFETQSRPLWRHRNYFMVAICITESTPRAVGHWRTRCLNGWCWSSSSRHVLYYLYRYVFLILTCVLNRHINVIFISMS